MDFFVISLWLLCGKWSQARDSFYFCYRNIRVLRSGFFLQLTELKRLKIRGKMWIVVVVWMFMHIVSRPLCHKYFGAHIQFNSTCLTDVRNKRQRSNHPFRGENGIYRMLCVHCRSFGMNDVDHLLAISNIFHVSAFEWVNHFRMEIKWRVRSKSKWSLLLFGIICDIWLHHLVFWYTNIASLPSSLVSASPSSVPR